MRNIDITSTYFSDLGFIQYDNIRINDLYFHKVSIQLNKHQGILELYQKFNIHLPENIKTSCFKRQTEFFIGRLAAQYALKSLDYPHNFILHKGQHGEPIWPKNHFGSISHSMHCPQTGAAIACLNREAKYVGIDIELKNNHSILNENPEILNHFLNPFEMRYLFNFNQFDPYIYLIIFSAKESTIKVIYSKYKIMLSFLDMKVIIIDIIRNRIFIHVNKNEMNFKVMIGYVLLESEVLTYNLL
ncbi:hypothetical protein F975_03045 [Acinetobacter sp. ANC 3789]|uniref:4'-phosphopantetheinyl transferase family protein n=1 Tax=unclassified Acinetobacter TaxID=196816 RepID=UPI0002CEB686|nr:MULTISPECIES: 4'-phosphopantetheinyl transferase superfamily protein [unclassified Acinetobacter]ENU79075.1 hypothetical protein F975_03045 [Acinetobacter sp. ANC 3789]TCB81941.1 4'-phosphopantetheinyl transferase superfamily protein [Acinetobacter sp. ANC 3791]